MARIGYLYLHNGMWEGKQIIPSSWVERSKEGKIVATNGFQYANLWWSRPDKGAYMALGRHSQVILIIPKLDIVAVMTGVLRDNEFYSVSGTDRRHFQSGQIRQAVARRSHCRNVADQRDTPGRDGKANRRQRHAGTGQDDFGKDVSICRQRPASEEFHVEFSRFGFVVGDHDQHRQGGAAHRPVYRAGRA